MRFWKMSALSAFVVVIAAMLGACSGGGEDSASNASQTGPEAAQWTNVSHFNTYTDGYGSVIAIAIVENVLETPLERVEIAMILKDANGEELDRSGGQIALLPPSAALPVKVIFNDGDETDWASVEPLVWRARQPGDTVAYTELALENVSEGNDPASSYIYEARGSVRNTGDAAAGFVMVHAAFFNGQDELVAVAHDGAGGELAPGGQAGFSVGTNTAAGEIERVELTPMARQVD
jgi:hypothetical protein